MSNEEVRRCPRCRRENPARASFCAGCGSPIGRAATTKARRSGDLQAAAVGAVVIAGFLLFFFAIQDRSPAAYADSSLVSPADSPLEPPPPRRPAAGQWETVGSWTGTGPKTTERFHISSDQWRIEWAAAETGDEGGGFQLEVYNAQGEHVSLVANQIGRGGDVSYVQQGPGTYYLVVNATQMRWEVRARDFK